MNRKASPNKAYWEELPWGESLGQLGSAHSVSYDPVPEDPADKVRAVAEEVSGKHFPRPARKIGFY